MKTTIIIDSSQRNTLDVSNSKWTYQMQRPFLNVKSIKLSGCIIPNSQYLINSNNNSLILNTGATDYTFSLVNGNYTPTTLATELQTQLNTNGFSSTFTISQSSTTSKFRLQSTVAVVYKFSENSSLGKILGFGATNTASTTDIYATNMYNLAEVKYYKLRIPKTNNLIESNISKINESFIIPNNANTGEYNYITDNTHIINDTENNQKRIDKLTIELFDDENNYANLNGLDYILFFVIEN
jgi:hypothetical protein